MGKPQLILLFLSVLLIQTQHISSLKLNNDGGYEILIALDESTPTPNVGAVRYIDNVKTAFAALSNRMWMSTKHRFYLKQVDLLLPSHWDVGINSRATTQSYDTSDIRLSPNVTYPHAENPNICGQPGNFIELPDSFFNVSNSGPFGDHRKSLLHTWALYRWGVHSEHGYVGDSAFPYAYKDLRSQQWSVTGCSNEAILGSFTNIKNPDASCETENGMSNECRFVPQTTGQNATTSLMHFHWVETVTEFCDEHNHNQHAPNKMNALCDHRSVWEVLRETPDYLAVTSPRNMSIPNLTLRTMKHSATPLLYILLDNGLVQGSYSIANKIPRLVATLVNGTSLQNTVAAIGTYPGTGTNVVDEIVEWSQIGSNLDIFLKAIGNLKADGPLERDFSQALVAVADKIKQKNHPNGAVVLLIKYGADTKSFGRYLPESEVLSAFNEQNIIFNAIELNYPEHTGVSHLANIAQGTGGSFTVLNNYGEAENNIRNVLSYVNKVVQEHYTDLSRDWKTLRREVMNTASSIAVPLDIKGTLEIFISSMNANLTRNNFILTGYNFSSSNPPQAVNFGFRKSTDWNEAGAKITYKLEVSKSALAGFSQLSLQLSCNSGDCSTSILARAEFTGETNQVKISVYTSIENNQADLSTGRPITIFAKITKNGKPVQDAMVVAKITETVSSRVTSLRLDDDGNGAPDAQKLDGIYSAYFAPEIDGQYRLSVSVEGNPLRNAYIPAQKVQESGYTRLLPIDQEDMGCGGGSCDNAEIIKGSFSQTVDLPAPFNVSQANLYIPSPTKIFSLIALDRPDLGVVLAYWLSPIVPGRLQSVTSYELRSASSRELLITDFDNQTIVPIPPNFRPKPPGQLENFSVQRPLSTTYYALRSVYRERKSARSNIAEYVNFDEETTTSGPTTPEISTPSGPTTPEISTPSGPTTPEISTPSGPTTPEISTTTGPTTPEISTTTGPTTPTGSVTPSSTVPTTTESSSGILKSTKYFLAISSLVIINGIFQ